MCEVVDISDDEDSFLLERNAGVVLKDENLDYDLPVQSTSRRPGEDVASSSGSDFRSSFIGMGFAPSLVDKAIEEKGEGNAESVLEALFSYSDRQIPKTEVSYDGFSGGLNGGVTANRNVGEDFRNLESLGGDPKENAYSESDILFKVEHDVGSSVNDEKTESLLKMNFTLDEVGFAMQRLGRDAPIGQLMDFIFAARMAKKYEKDTNNPFPGNEETTEDCNNEVLFGIMEKSLQLLEMGFSENEISEAFERCGSEAPATLLAESIVTGGTCPLPEKYPSTSLMGSTLITSSTPLSTSTAQRSCPSLKRKTVDRNAFCFKTEEYISDVAAEAGTSDPCAKLKGKMPEVEIDEPIHLKKLKEEFMEDSTSSAGRMWLEARLGARNPTPAPQKRTNRVASIEEDRKPTLSMPNPSKGLSSVVAKPPYFLYANVTNLCLNSWAKVSQFLYGIPPEFVESQMFSAVDRKEGYVHNLPRDDRFHISPKGPMRIAEAIPHSRKSWPSWDNRKHLTHISCESTGLPYLCEKLGRIMAESNGFPSADQQRNILQQCLSKNLVWISKHKLAPLEPEHLEHIMGYPVHHTRIAGFTSTDRMQALKLSFQTDTLGYHLSVLKRLCPDGVTVLSFFSGIGGAEVALHRLGIRLRGVVAVEPNEMKRRMMKKWWESSAQRGELIQLEGMSKLTSSKLEEVMKKLKGFDLVVCQNPYSGGGEGESLAGQDFSSYVEFVRILQRVKATMERNR